MLSFSKDKIEHTGDPIKENHSNIKDETEDQKLTNFMIKKIALLRTTTVKEVMVPRIDMVSVKVDNDVDEIISIIGKTQFSRIPVWKKSIDDIIGILYSKDLLNYIDRKNEIKLDKILREPYFVPESKMLLSMLKEFQKKKIHLAMVIDEYGGVSGIVTLEDILEEIVGEIQDEYDFEEEPIKMLSEKIFDIDARLDIDELNDKLGLQLKEEDIDTIGGFVFKLFGEIPLKGQKVQYNSIEFEVISIEGSRLKRILLTKLPK